MLGVGLPTSYPYPVCSICYILAASRRLASQRLESDCHSHVRRPETSIGFILISATSSRDRRREAQRRFARIFWYDVPRLLLTQYAFRSWRREGRLRDARSRFCTLSISWIICEKYGVLWRRRFANVMSSSIPMLICAKNCVFCDVATIGIGPESCRMAPWGFYWLFMHFGIGVAMTGVVTCGVDFTASCPMASRGSLRKMWCFMAVSLRSASVFPMLIYTSGVFCWRRDARYRFARILSCVFLRLLLAQYAFWNRRRDSSVSVC
jgi:hypothetical protein